MDASENHDSEKAPFTGEDYAQMDKVLLNATTLQKRQEPRLAMSRNGCQARLGRASGWLMRRSSATTISSGSLGWPFIESKQGRTDKRTPDALPSYFAGNATVTCWQDLTGGYGPKPPIEMLKQQSAPAEEPPGTSGDDCTKD